MIKALTLSIVLLSCVSIQQQNNATEYVKISPDFDFKNVINVPPTTNGYDPCRFFQIKDDHIYRMGKSNIIGKWNVYNNSNYQ
jgi:hypothetical protein